AVVVAEDALPRGQGVKGLAANRREMAAVPTAGRRPARAHVLTGTALLCGERERWGEALRRADGGANNLARAAGARCVPASVPAGKGSAADPRLIEMAYEAAGGAAKTVAIVGKAITFDCGGLDLKTADGMYSMKTDMGGGASVLGAMLAVAALKPQVKVIGLM